MKKHLFILAMLAMALHSCGPVYVVHQDPPPQQPAPAPPPEPAPEVSYQSFYDDLSPYGQWIDHPGYGYVWMPNVGPDFKPYSTNGHWVYTDEGWTWASDYNWGWATFHYGRWFYEDGYGWMWMPGHEWAPAWVSWRSSQDYYGWAPLAPNVSVSVSFGGGYNPPSHYWNFVPHEYVSSPHVNNYYVNETKNVTIINNTTIINNNVRNTNITNNNITNNTTNNNITNNRNTTVNNIRNNYAAGPDPAEVGRFAGAPVRPVQIRQSSTPGEQMNGGQLAIYRPRVNPASQPAQSTGNGSQPRPAPTRFQPLNNARPVNTTRYNNGNESRFNGQAPENTQPGGNRPVTTPFRPRETPGQPASMTQPPTNGQPAGNSQPSNAVQPSPNGQPAMNNNNPGNANPPNGNTQPGGNRPPVNPFIRSRDGNNQPANAVQPSPNGQPAMNNNNPGNADPPNGNTQPGGNRPPVNPFIRSRDGNNQPANAVQPSPNGQPAGSGQPVNGSNTPPANSNPRVSGFPNSRNNPATTQPAHLNPNVAPAPAPGQPGVQPKPNPPKPFVRPIPHPQQVRGRDSVRTRNQP